MNNITVFNYKTQSVRTVTRADGAPWWVARDVCEVLGLTNVTEAARHLDDDEKMTITNPERQPGQRGGAQNLIIVNEPGLYSLILRSRKPEARAFKRWVTHEVLPTIRKTGGTYMSPDHAEQALMDPDFIIKMAIQIKMLKADLHRQSFELQK